MDSKSSLHLPHLFHKAVVVVIKIQEDLHQDCSLVWILAPLRSSQVCHRQGNRIHLMQFAGDSVIQASVGMWLFKWEVTNQLPN
jgi:hypothetical protein